MACVGDDGRKSCSARSANYIRTYKAEIGIADGQPPAVSVTADTPLARGEWVAGTQPLNYDATRQRRRPRWRRPLSASK